MSAMPADGVDRRAALKTRTSALGASFSALAKGPVLAEEAEEEERGEGGDSHAAHQGSPVSDPRTQPGPAAEDADAAASTESDTEYVETEL